MQEPRQLYGLGSFVKKITKPIKKIVKSPIGKAALLGAGAYFAGGGGNPFTAAGRSGFGSNPFGALIKRGLLGAKTAAGERGIVREGGLKGLLGKLTGGFGNLSGGQQLFLGGGAALSLLPFLTGGAEEEEDIVEDTFDVTPSSIANIRQMARDRDSSLAFLPQQKFVRPGFYAAEGGTPRAELFAGGLPMLLRGMGGMGSMDQETLMKILKMGGSLTPAGIIRNLMSSRKGAVPTMEAAEGGVAELPKVRMLEGGVPEIDYRESGGFVPMGKKEKADDVPAMLSKNEFVMTADAVRGMGDGNVEKGAQRMYDQMRQLENRVV